jgi:Zn-dependent alcohol dehydrogenase
VLHLETIITHKFPLKDIEEAAKIMGTGNCGKVVLTLEEDDYV